MRAFEEDRSNRNYRGNISRELKEIATKALVDIEMESVTLYKLLRAFENAMHRFDFEHEKETVHTIINYNYTIQEQQEFLLSRLQKGQKMDFKNIFETCKNRIHAIVTFLGILELLNAGEITILQGGGNNNFWLALPEL
jgi:segregation and condensation protein A